MCLVPSEPAGVDSMASSTASQIASALCLPVLLKCSVVRLLPFRGHSCTCPGDVALNLKGGGQAQCITLHMHDVELPPYMVCAHSNTDMLYMAIALLHAWLAPGGCQACHCPAMAGT